MTTRIFRTKYAITKGITTHEAIPCPGDDDSCEICIGDLHYTTYLHRGEWFADWETALLNAEERRLAAIKSCERKLDKLRSLTFTEPKP